MPSKSESRLGKLYLFESVCVYVKGGGKDRQILMDSETHVSQAGPELVKDDLKFLTTFLYLQRTTITDRYHHVCGGSRLHACQESTLRTDRKLYFFIKLITLSRFADVNQRSRSHPPTLVRVCLWVTRVYKLLSLHGSQVRSASGVSSGVQLPGSVS